MPTPVTLEIAPVRTADGWCWVAYLDGDTATIPGTTTGHEPTTAAHAALMAIDAGWLTDGGRAIVLDAGWGKDPQEWIRIHGY